MSELEDVASAVDYGSSLLVGERVRLRALADEDVPQLVGWWSDSAWSILQQSSVKPRPAAAIESMIRGWSDNASPSGVGFSIVNRDNMFVGHVTLWGLTLPVRTATLAIIVGPEFVDQGLGADAVRTLCRYAFREMGANKVDLQTYAFNARAIAAYSKVGFVQEGRRRAAVFHDGSYSDEILMGLLASELS
jgi:RimJ/RimL family protein N-acetyltransferase